jgi:hypothetical protein
LPTQFETVIYIKAQTELSEVAHNVFAALGGGEYISDNDAALGGDYYRLSSLGLEGTVFANDGEMEDEDFAGYPYGLGVVSTYHDPELELAAAETALGDYYCRLLAFELNVEVATSFYLGGQDGVDLYEIRAFKRNPQWTLDAGPTAQRVYVSERRTVEYDSELPDEDFDEEAPFEDE